MALEIYKTTTSNPDALGIEAFYLTVDTVTEQTLFAFSAYYADYYAEDFEPVLIGDLPAWLQSDVTLFCYNPTDLVIEKFS